MRSRCAGSMFAWILKTKPLKRPAVGGCGPLSVLRGAGAGARSRKASRNGRTPKLVIAEPKNIGVICPRSLFSRLKASPPTSRSSTSSRSWASSAGASTWPMSGESSETARSPTSASPWVPSEEKTWTTRAVRS